MTPEASPSTAQASTRPLAERRWGRWALATLALAGGVGAGLAGWRAGLMVLGALAPVLLALLTWREQALIKRLARAAEAMAALDLPFLLLDSEDRVRWASAAFARLYPGLGQVPIGMRYEELAQRALDSGAIEVPAERRQEWLRQRLDAHARASDLRWQPMRDGRTLQVLEKRTRLGGWVSFYFDVSELAQAETRLREANLAGQRAQQMLEDALEAMPAGFEIWDRDDRLLLCNQRLIELYPGSAEYLKPGVSFEEAARIQLGRGQIPAAVGRESQWLGERLAQRGRLGRPFLMEYSGRWIQIDERRMRDGRLVCVRQDVTELVEARRAMTLAQVNAERQHRVLAQAVDALPVALDLYDEQDRLLIANRQYRLWNPKIDYDRLIGTRFEDMLREGLRQGLAPAEALADPEAWIAQRLAQHGRGGEPLLQQLPNGRVALVQEARTVDGLTVVTRQDVSRIVAKEQALAVVHAQLQAIFDTAAAAIVTFDARGRIHSVNPAAARLWGLPPERVLGLPASTLVAPEARQALIETFDAHVQGQTAGLFGQRHEYPVLRGEGGERGLISAVISEVRGGEQRLFVAVFDDITEQRRAEQQLREANERLAHLSATDALTGLANRRRLLERLQQLWSSAQRHQSPLAALLIDVDHFKRYNDHHGHQAGDAALVALAEMLRGCARRATDLVARYGGEEFVVLLEDCEAEAALSRAEGLRIALRERALPHGNAPLGRISVSVGVASLVPEPGQRLEELLSRADAALYRAKAAGRDRAVLAA